MARSWVLSPECGLARTQTLGGPVSRLEFPLFGKDLNLVTESRAKPALEAWVST